MNKINFTSALKSRYKFSTQTFVVMFLAIAAFAFAVGLTPQGLQSQTPSPDLINKYNLAVADAQVAELNEVSKNLVAITENNQSLIWQNKYGKLVIERYPGDVGIYF